VHLISCAVRRAWSRCLTGRVFAFTLWTTCVLAALEFSCPAAGLCRLQQETPDILTQTADSVCSAHPVAGVTLAVSAADREIVDLCWGASAMQITQAWQSPRSPGPTLVAVLDTGIDADNAHLAGRVEDSVALTGTTGANDLCGHGTHIAGTIAAIAPNCRLLNVKVADDRGFCDTQSVARGIRLAADRGASVINLSLEVEPSAELEAAAMYAWGQGAVLVAAAGMPSAPAAPLLGDVSFARRGSPRPAARLVYPACYSPVIAVTAVTETGQVAPASNLAPWVDVAAPGHRTYSVVPGGRGYLTGTSSAAAHVSGLAALLCGLAEDRNGNGFANDEVRRAIEVTAVPMSIEGTGKGMVNAPAAVVWLTSEQPGQFE